MGLADVSIQRLLPASGAGELGHREASPAAAGVWSPGELGVGQVLDRAFELFLHRFGTYVGFVTLFLLPIHLAAELFVLAPPTDQSFFVAYGQGIFTFFIVLWGVARVFVATLAGSDALGRPLPVSHALRATLARLPGLILLLLLATLIQAAGFLACVLPVFLVVWLLEPALPVFALESGVAPAPGGGRRRDVLGFSAAFDALRRAPRIARGGSSLLRWVACTFLSLVFAAPFLLQFQSFQSELGFREALQAELPPAGTALVLACASAFLQAIGLGFRSVVVCVFYLDERVRKEGLDLELALARRNALRAGRSAR